MDSSNNLYFDLSHFVTVSVTGDDAKSFLQNQITGNLDDLEKRGWLLSAWCQPKGRVICNFIIYPFNNGFHLLLPSMLKESVLKRLSMFIMRSKVELKDVSDEFSLLGLYGSNSTTVINQVDETLQAYGSHLQLSKTTAIITLEQEPARAILSIENEQLKKFMNRILMGFTESNRSHWSLLDIENGIPWITSATTELFLPQMLNLDLSGGLSFKKGCYPGQEVIARLNYRGELKKRLYVGTASSKLAPGPADELEAIDSGKLLGHIIDAEPGQDNLFRVLAVAELASGPTLEASIRSCPDSKVQLRQLHDDSN